MVSQEGMNLIIPPPRNPFRSGTFVTLFYKAVLIQYEILAGSDGKQARATSSSSASRSTAATPSSPPSRNGRFQPLTSSGEKLVDEITGLLGGDSLQGMGRRLMADLKNKMGTSNPPPITASPPEVQQHQQPRHSQGADPKAKYMEKVRVGAVARKYIVCKMTYILPVCSRLCTLLHVLTLCF